MNGDLTADGTRNGGSSLRDPADIEAAGRAAVADWPPLDDDTVRLLAPLIAPGLRAEPETRTA